MAIDADKVVFFHEQALGEACMPKLTDAQWERILAKRRDLGRPLETAEVLAVVEADNCDDRNA